VTQDFLDYSQSSGVYQSDQCSQGAGLFNHTLLVIGFGSETTPTGVVKYWLVQNSWGENWGINGYAKIVRGMN
jgi:C1A family cysteine protease